MRKVTRALLGLALGLAVSLPALAAGKDLEGTPQAKVYRANGKAVAAGDFEAYKKTMSADSLKMTPKELMEFVKMMSPTDIKLTDLKVDGKKATLSMTGKSDGAMMKGSADMVEEGGQWKIAKQEWSNAK